MLIVGLGYQLGNRTGFTMGVKAYKSQIGFITFCIYIVAKRLLPYFHMYFHQYELKARETFASGVLHFPAGWEIQMK
jgi:hypothetical protein